MKERVRQKLPRKKKFMAIAKANARKSSETLLHIR